MAAAVALPKQVLDAVQPAQTFPSFRKKWLTNEEVVSVLMSYDSHSDWLSTCVSSRPPNGTVLLVNRKATKYKNDGYCWKMRKDSKVSVREDTMRLKIHSFEIVKCLCAHYSLVPTFHRRSYWLFVSPDVVLVHYLNVINDQPNICVKSVMETSSPLSYSYSAPPPLITLPQYWPRDREWNKEELLNELRPMC